MRRFILGGLFLAALSFALGITPSLKADSTDLSTGVDLVGNVDQRWTVSYTYGTDVATNESTVLAATTPGSTALNDWVANTSTSAWIRPNDPLFTDNNAPPPGNSSPLTLTYTTTFNIAAGQSAYASIVGLVTTSAQWTADNDALSISLNGNVINAAGPPSTDSTPFTRLWSIGTINSGFVDGTNTLVIQVVNQPQDSGNPTGMRFEGQVQIVTPEPSALAIAGVGALGFGANAWRRRVRKGKKS